MRFLAFLVRLALGLAFVVFGLNIFLNFIKLPAPSGHAGEFMKAMMATRYMWAVGALEVAGGALLLLGRVPLGLTLLGPVVVNIVLYHALMDRSGLGGASVFGALSLFLLWCHKDAFPAIFPKSEPAKKPAKK